MSAWADQPGRDVPVGWAPVDELEPRWDPSVPLARRMTRLGRWQDVDPLRHGGVWSRWKWLTLAGYLGLLGSALGVAYAWHRPLVPPDGE